LSEDSLDNSIPVTSIDQEENVENSWISSVRYLMSNRNFKIFVVTNWIVGSLGIIWQVLNLYLRDLGIDYIALGFLYSIMTIVLLLGNFVASYLADNYNRRNLAIVTMALNGMGYLILAFATSFEMVAFGLLIIATSNFTGQGGTAYIMQIIDRKYGGVAVSLFTLGTIFALGPLFAMAIMFNAGWEFIFIMRVVFFVGSILFGVTVVIRILWLDSTPIPERERHSSILRDFISESYRGLKLLLRVFPILVGVMMIDALSDGFYNFSNLFYVNETLDFNIGQIFLMLLITMIVSVPLTLFLGRRFDQRGGKGITLAVYSVMPIALTLLIVAKYIPYVAPDSWVTFLDTVYPGLGVILSLAFIATAIKTTNDNLWRTVLDSYVQKSLPKADIGKMLGLSALMVQLVGIISPIFSGIIYTLYEGVPLIIGAIILNIIIIIILKTKSIEPRVDVLALEEELKSNYNIHLEE
jgi:MFS family permease